MYLKKLIPSVLVGAAIGLGSIAAPTALAGKPCVGCVGNADNKTPGGQSVDDHNNGYTCDGNNGVGQGNPAHSHNCDGGGATG